MSAGIVVIGTGQGGYQLAASLRQEGYAGAITLIGEEPGLPYQRPPLSKAYLADGDPGRLLLKPASFYERAGIVVLEAARATRIDRANRRVETDSGRTLPYDHLVLATGGRALCPPLPGLEAEGVLALRTLAHAARLRDRMAAARQAIVIGGGFIGLEFAAVARAAGRMVTVIEAAPRLMARVLSPPMSSRFLAAHREMGAEIRLGTPAAGILVEGGRAAGVRLADGAEIAADLVLIAAGVRPNVELAAEAGLAVENGVLVDATLRTSDPDISALGDCAAFPLPDGGRVRLESVQAAVDHARHIARRLAGQGEMAPYDAVPWFWSDQGKLKLQIAGLGAAATRWEVAEQPNGEPMVLCLREDRLIAVETVNAPGQHMAARKLIGTPLAALTAAGFDLRALSRA